MANNMLEYMLVIFIIAFIATIIYGKASNQSLKEVIQELIEAFKPKKVGK